jgi:sortase (surface protein transpeptidase)
MDCDAIRGTPYLSPDERQWYLENCLASPSGPDGGPTTGSEYSIGARLVIPSIGVNAVVVSADVGSNGIMPDPTGYFSVVLYNFPFHSGVGDKNRIISGHVDCAACINGGPGAAVFWSVRTLGSGASVQYVNPDGSVTEYVVFASYSTDPNVNWDAILADDAADMTLITCTGTFSAGEYSNRHVVQLRRVAG